MNTPPFINRLLVVSVFGETLAALHEGLVKSRFYFTQIESSGGIIQKETACLLIGIPESREEELMRLIRRKCRRRKTFVPARLEAAIMPGMPVMIEGEAGGALVYTLDVEHFEQF